MGGLGSRLLAQPRLGRWLDYVGDGTAIATYVLGRHFFLLDPDREFGYWNGH